MKGFITCFVNFAETATNEQKDEKFHYIQAINKDLFVMLKKDGYEIMFVPTYNESTRMEKLDFDSVDSRKEME